MADDEEIFALAAAERRRAADMFGGLTSGVALADLTGPGAQVLAGRASQ